MSPADLQQMRQDYARESLTERDVDADPIAQFGKWFEQARNAGLVEPNAMTLATVDYRGLPSARVVLLKGVDRRGFVFFTDYRSRKGEELEQNPAAALCFWWDVLQRQVRIEGIVKKVSLVESAEYFRSRPRGSQIGAWASHQSAPLARRGELDDAVAARERLHPEGTEVPLPPHWGGFCLEPSRIEFWQGRPSRLHDRIVYTRFDSAWTIGRLSP
jgi:pyridoxamine 5'-phosphate oxidase